MCARQPVIYRINKEAVTNTIYRDKKGTLILKILLALQDVLLILRGQNPE